MSKIFFTVRLDRGLIQDFIEDVNLQGFTAFHGLTLLEAGEEDNLWELEVEPFEEWGND